MNAFRLKFRILLALLLADSIFNAYLVSSATKSIFKLVLSVTQVILLLVSLFVTFLLLWNTFLFRYGLLGLLFAEIKWYICVYPLYLIATVAFDVWLFVVNSDWDSHVFVWAFVIHTLAAVSYYATTATVALKLSETKFYDENEWFDD